MACMSTSRTCALYGDQVMKMQIRPEFSLDLLERIPHAPDCVRAHHRAVLHAVLEDGHEFGDKGAEVDLGRHTRWDLPRWRGRRAVLYQKKNDKKRSFSTTPSDAPATVVRTRHTTPCDIPSGT